MTPLSNVSRQILANKPELLRHAYIIWPVLCLNQHTAVTRAVKPE